MKLNDFFQKQQQQQQQQQKQQHKQQQKPQQQQQVWHPIDNFQALLSKFHLRRNGFVDWVAASKPDS